MDWNDIIIKEQKKPYYNNLYEHVKKEYETHTCYPPFENIFNAFSLTSYDDVKCVILGQDPYHEPGQAMGLSFSVPENISIPRSLQNIYQEIHDELGCYIPDNGDLTKWAKQGVLMLNSILTVRAHSAASHASFGWENFTDAILSAVNDKNTPVVFMLWGQFAKSKRPLITNTQHKILQTTHPSPFSARYGFIGCGHFKTCNDFLQANKMQPIDWQIENRKA